MAYLFTPLLFCILGYVLLFSATSPWLMKAAATVNLVLLDKPYQFDQTVSDIYTQNSTDSKTVSIKEVQFPTFGTIYGRFQIPSVGIDYPLVFGDDSKALKKGAAQYPGSYIPGYGGSILLAGHNYMFRDIGGLKTGALIRVATSYGNYQYKVTAIKILDKNDPNSYTIQKGREQLIFYTCYPFNALGSINTRFFVYADYVSGPKILP